MSKMSKSTEILIIATCCLACLVTFIGIFIGFEQFKQLESEKKQANLFNDGIERPAPEVICLPRRWVGFDRKGNPVCM